MADVDPALVKLIAEQVMAALRKGSEAPPSPMAAGTPADVHAPIGICTGDYSKFPELAHLREQSPANTPIAAPAQPAPSAAPAPEPKPAAAMAAPVAPKGEVLAGVITADRLKKIKGQIILAKGALLTPLAQDYIKDHNLRPVQQTDGQQTLSTHHSALSTLYWWIDGGCPSVQNAVQAFHANLMASTHPYSGDHLKAVIRELASLVKTKRVAGGVLFVPSAARAVVYANRCGGLRAIVATCEEAVQQGIETVGANVLIIEYPYHGTKSMLPLVQRLLDAQRAPLPVVERELTELKTCGY